MIRSFVFMCFTSTLFFPFCTNAAEANNKTSELIAVVDQYYTALERKNLAQLSKIVDPELIVLEGTHKNVSWADFRDHHIGPEMKEWKSFSTKNRKIARVQESGNMGFVIVELSYDIVLPKETLSLSGAETFILQKAINGVWKIVHVHSSAKLNAPQN